MKTLPLENYDALLFDLDGTLADSMAIHNEAWIATFKDLGFSVTPELLTQYAGIPNQRTVEIFNQRFGWHLDPQSVARDKEQRFLQNIDFVRPIESVLKIAQTYYQIKKMAIVSGGTKNLVDQILNVLKIASLFSVKVCAEDVPLGKPHPDPFLFAAKVLKVSPTTCLVFEDGESGIKGAKAAGMGVVRVRSDFDMMFLS
ncbi:MAG: HAD family phosphatase [Bdellovibrionaceae bacterium]|nr:HAD family phosphatase [Pseudobdellovibrionaceae bacterium]